MYYPNCCSFELSNFLVRNSIRGFRRTCVTTQRLRADVALLVGVGADVGGVTGVLVGGAVASLSVALVVATTGT